MNLVSKICSDCSISRFLTFIARFLSSFLQDGEVDKKYFAVMDTNFFIYNVLGGESFCTLFEFFM